MRTRRALPGELCTCGRQAVEVFEFDGDDGDRPPIGYCGIPDGGEQQGPCSFCGRARHVGGRCPQYRLVPHPAWSIEAVVWQLATQEGLHEDARSELGHDDQGHDDPKSRDGRGDG